MKIVFFGTSEVGLPILEALIDQHEVIHVITSPDAKVGRKQVLTPSPISRLADEKNIPVSKPAKVKNNPEFLEFLRGLNAHIFVVVSYGKILPADLLEIPKLKTINVHFSLLPKYRGPAPIQFALLNGETKTGTTIFILDELVDHGPILSTQECDIDATDNFETLANKLSKISAALILDTLPKYEAVAITPQEQNHEEATTTKIISKQDGKINFAEQTAQTIFNMHRAFTPWPQIWTTYKGEAFKILSCSIPNINESDTAKDIVLCKDNTFLKLEEVQLAGKNKMTMKDFLNGHPEFTCSNLGK